MAPVCSRNSIVAHERARSSLVISEDPKPPRGAWRTRIGLYENCRNCHPFAYHISQRACYVKPPRAGKGGRPGQVFSAMACGGIDPARLSSRESLIWMVPRQHWSSEIASQGAGVFLAPLLLSLRLGRIALSFELTRRGEGERST